MKFWKVRAGLNRIELPDSFELNQDVVAPSRNLNHHGIHNVTTPVRVAVLFLRVRTPVRRAEDHFSDYPVYQDPVRSPCSSSLIILA